MSWANQPVGWQPENTDATMYCPSTAVAKGDLMQCVSAFTTTQSATDPGGGIPGLTTLAEPTATAADKTGTVWCVALQDGVAYKPTRVRLRGRVFAKVEKDATDITTNMELVAGESETTSANVMMAAADLNASSATISPGARKILAISDESGDATVNVEDFIWVNFNGVEGFGTYVGDTPA